MHCLGAVIFIWHLLVFHCCAMGAWLWLRRCILHIWVASSWIASWWLYLTGLRYWYCWRVIVPAYDSILRVLLGVFFWQEFLIGLNDVFGIRSFLRCHPYQVGEVLLIYFLPLVAKWYWDFFILLVYRNDVGFLVADILIQLLMVVVRLDGGQEYVVLIGPCEW